uniref:Uncharacterized protein n=1 Tax=Molossus molossus TaxID=27622 RepID=A0A7J8CS46_MOLMO|nr:hypothetical protein HJG59_009776 [Molossus molossus]
MEPESALQPDPGGCVCTLTSEMHCTLGCIFNQGSAFTHGPPPLTQPPADERPWLPELSFLRSPCLPDSTSEFRNRHASRACPAHTQFPRFRQSEKTKTHLHFFPGSARLKSVDFSQIFPQWQRSGGCEQWEHNLSTSPFFSCSG